MGGRGLGLHGLHRDQGHGADAARRADVVRHRDCIYSQKGPNVALP